jgi:hypothetical protein
VKKNGKVTMSKPPLRSDLTRDRKEVVNGGSGSDVVRGGSKGLAVERLSEHPRIFKVMRSPVNEQVNENKAYYLKRLFCLRCLSAKKTTVRSHFSVSCRIC